MADSLESRERALREWVTANPGTPLGRVAGKLLAEDDAGNDPGRGMGPEYYSGLFFALGAVMDEVLR